MNRKVWFWAKEIPFGSILPTSQSLISLVVIVTDDKINIEQLKLTLDELEQ
jgi:hypothetical protein